MPPSLSLCTSLASSSGGFRDSAFTGLSQDLNRIPARSLVLLRIQVKTNYNTFPSVVHFSSIREIWHFGLVFGSLCFLCVLASSFSCGKPVSSFLAYILGNSNVIRQVSRNAVLLNLLPDKCYQCLFPSIDFFIAPNMGQRNVGQGVHAR